MLKGRAEIAREYAQFTPAERQIKIDSISFLGPDVALLDAQYKSRSRAHVSYIVVKRDGQWFIRFSRVTILEGGIWAVLIVGLVVGALAGIGFTLGLQRFSSRRSRMRLGEAF